MQDCNTQTAPAKIAVVVPAYRRKLEEYDLYSFKRTIDVFDRRDIFIVCSRSFDAGEYVKIRPQIKIERFDDGFFKSKNSYSRLCLSRCFYERFQAGYDFILICQLDAVAVEDRLDEWTMYDYAGAPFCHLCGLKTVCMSKEFLHAVQKENYVGNGGFSLRRISSFLKLAEGLNIDELQDPEDVIISRTDWMKFPVCKKALFFAQESYAPLYLKLGIKPVGLHNMITLYPQYSKI